MDGGDPKYVKKRKFPRDPHDFYVEETKDVAALLAAERFRGEVYDPACGRGTIVAACRARGLNAYGTDLIDRGYGFTGGVDFTQPVPASAVGNVDNIICNPPFKHARVFIANALLRARYKVAMLVPLAFIEGIKKKPFLEGTPWARSLVFSYRLNMPPGDVPVAKKGGWVAFQWIVFDHDHQGPPTLGLL